MEIDTDQLLTMTQAAHLVGRSYHNWQYYVKQGRTPSPIIVAGRPHFKVEDIKGWKPSKKYE